MPRARNWPAADCRPAGCAGGQTSAIGGPLVNLNGQVIGITVGGSGSGLQIIGYAIPINTALAVATRIADGDS
jgi:S1-C subfamily serine protease